MMCVADFNIIIIHQCSIKTNVYLSIYLSIAISVSDFNTKF